MKNIPLLLFCVVAILSKTSSYSQDFNSNDWLLFDEENVQYLVITKSETIKLDNYTLEIVWNDKLKNSSNLKFYGGIESLKIFNNGILINSLADIEDTIA